jgi:hypothetical protein
MNICLQARSPGRWLCEVHGLIWTFQLSPPKQFLHCLKRSGAKSSMRNDMRDERDDHFSYFLLQNKGKHFLKYDFALDLFRISTNLRQFSQ